MSALKQGDRISNYLVEARLGCGSFGEVWRARHHVFGDVVAIKVPTDAQYVKNLQREGVAVHGLKHPNIVRAIDLDPYAEPPYFVMEFVDGPSLREVIDRHRASFPITSAVAIMRGILGALAAAHEAGLIHRDVKPANVLLSHAPESLESVTEQTVKVTDFGLGHVGGVTTQSIMQSGSMLTGDGRSVAGTLAYMSPEQKEGLPLDGRSDLYSCGIVLFEMLTGERPQGGDPPSSLRPDVPGAIDEVFRRSYTRCDRRYPEAREMSAALGVIGPLKRPDPPDYATGVPPPRGLRCRACHAPVERNDNFCIRCGGQIVASVPRCRHCGEFVHGSDRFCIRCGKSLTVLT